MKTGVFSGFLILILVTCTVFYMSCLSPCPGYEAKYSTGSAEEVVKSILKFDNSKPVSFNISQGLSNQDLLRVYQALGLLKLDIGHRDEIDRYRENILKLVVSRKFSTVVGLGTALSIVLLFVGGALIAAGIPE